jgi:hypothetical protein
VLYLYQVELGDGALFSVLAVQPACPLSSITLHSCNIKDTAVQVAAAALARLPSLRACNVDDGGTVTLCIASQLTALTHLEGELEADVPPADTQLVKAVSRNKGLQSLDVSLSRSASLSAEMLQCLLNSCTNLTQLDLSSQDVDDQGLDVLLQHGTTITDLKLGNLQITLSRADSRCRWQRLCLVGTSGVLAGLAYLPLNSVQELKTGDSAEALYLPFILSPQLTPLLQQAVSNLKTCPAWQRQPATRVLLLTDLPSRNVDISDSQVAQLFSALSPLGGPHLQHLGISLLTEFGQQEVQVLSRSLGSSLRSLSLRRGVIKRSFWPALSQHLPHLKELGLMHKVQVSITDITAYLRTLTQPLTLYIGQGVVADHIVADLTDTIGVWQLQGVSVQQEYPADYRDFHLQDSCETGWEAFCAQQQQETDSEGNDEDEDDEEEEEGEEEDGEEGEEEEGDGEELVHSD